MAQVRHVGEVIGIDTKAGITVVPALDDMQCNAGKDQPSMSGHIARTKRSATG
jgi:hypothetical protein